MKRGILRSVEITVERAGRMQLDHVSLMLTEGDSVGVIGRDGSGKDSLAAVLTGEIEASSGIVLYREKTVGREYLRRYGQRIHRKSRLIHTLTVMENLMLQQGALFWKGRQLMLLCAELLEDFGLVECMQASPSELPLVLHQRLLLVQAVLQGKQFVVIESPSERFSKEEQLGLLHTIQTVCQRGIAVMYASRQMDFIQQNLNTTAIMAEGKVVKLLPPKELSPTLLRTYLYGNLIESQGMYSEATSNAPMFPLPNLQVQEGDFLVVHDYDGTADQLIQALRYSCNLSNFRIQGIIDDEILDGSFIEDMTVFDNILISVARKMGGLGWRISRNTRRLLREECKRYVGLTDKQMRSYPDSLFRRERLRLLLYRFWILGARVFVIDRLGIDKAGRIELKQLLSVLLEAGCAVLFITERADDAFHDTARTFSWTEEEQLQEERK